MIVKERVVEETHDYVVKQLQDGSFKREMKYHKFFSHIPETQEKQIELYKVFNAQDNEDIVTPLSRMVGDVIGIDEFYTNPYQSFDEETGVSNNGVTTTIKDGDDYYVTSSKSVYHTLFNLTDTFGSPSDENYKKIFVKVTGTKRTNGIQIDLSLEGIGEDDRNE
ncbi:MAG TPA: hypothetical protein VK982_09180 [Bacteroidales bacterium]|nr:hypothetical protein [Bacteroidales bacterium]